MREIQSDELVDTESHFKLVAGPGAGKTHWLVCHVRNVLAHSKRLGRTARIACITYTNTAADEMRRRLGDCAGRVEVSTIHSFLYRNVVKPFAFLLKDEDGSCLIDLERLDGHDENLPSKGIVSSWLNDTKQLYLSKKLAAVCEALALLDWKFDDKGALSLQSRKVWKLRVGQYSIKGDSLQRYKQICWNKGELHHEDVLYFSFRVLSEFPRTLRFLAARFPYLYIDEFQDTHPVQARIVKLIAEHAVTVGVVGDPAQSIFKFQGAARKDFVDFTLPGIQELIIAGNRRSTDQIVGFLNRTRGDNVVQRCLRCTTGDTPKILVGDLFRAIRFVEEDASQPTVLARNNSTISKIVRAGTVAKWQEARQLDADYQRQRLLYHSLLALELAHGSDFIEARRLATKLFRHRAWGDARRREAAIGLIKRLVTKRDTYLEMSVFDYLNELHTHILKKHGYKIGARLTKRGEFGRGFAQNHKCRDLVPGFRLDDCESRARTIHKAKGAEFDTVLVVLDGDKDLKRLLKPTTEGEEDEGRLLYVALSRAVNSLYITVPTMNEIQRSRARAKMGLEVVDLDPRVSTPALGQQQLL